MWSQIFPMSQSNHPSKGQEAEEFGGTAGASCGGALKTPFSAKILSRGEGGGGELGSSVPLPLQQSQCRFLLSSFPQPLGISSCPF